MIRDLKKETPGLFKKIKNMPLRARVGRKKEELNKSTICYIKDQKRDAFIKVNEKGETEELTFLETIKIFEAEPVERGIKLHDQHHEQVQTSIALFTDLIEAEKARDKKVDVTQGPNEKRAIAYLDAMLDLPFTNEKERGLIIKAKEAIRHGRFQGLQRDINKLKRAVNKAPLKPALILEKITGILRSYPLQAMHEEDEDAAKPRLKKSLNPEIIISESFVK